MRDVERRTPKVPDSLDPELGLVQKPMLLASVLLPLAPNIVALFALLPAVAAISVVGSVRSDYETFVTAGLHCLTFKRIAAGHDAAARASPVAAQLRRSALNKHPVARHM